MGALPLAAWLKAPSLQVYPYFLSKERDRLWPFVMRGDEGWGVGILGVGYGYGWQAAKGVCGIVQETRGEQNGANRQGTRAEESSKDLAGGVSVAHVLLLLALCSVVPQLF